jgi:hypothetical protein
MLPAYQLNNLLLDKKVKQFIKSGKGTPIKNFSALSKYRASHSETGV